MKFLSIPPTTDANRIRISQLLEQALMRYMVWLVEVKGTVIPATSFQYAKNVRAAISDHYGFSVNGVFPHRLLPKLFEGLVVAHPTQPKQRAPVLQQHLLSWCSLLDFTLHCTRSLFTLAIVLWSTASRFSDLGPHSSSLFDPAKDLTYSDFIRVLETAYLRITDHKTSKYTKWEPKPLPLPHVRGAPITFPFVHGPHHFPSMDSLVHHVGDLPSSIILSPYFQLQRMIALTPASALRPHPDPSSRPLFLFHDGTPICYDAFRRFIILLSDAIGCTSRVHDLRRGGTTSAFATGQCDRHTAQVLGYWLSDSMPVHYTQATERNLVNVMTSMADSESTAVLPSAHFAPPASSRKRRRKHGQGPQLASSAAVHTKRKPTQILV